MRPEGAGKPHARCRPALRWAGPALIAASGLALALLLLGEAGLGDTLTRWMLVSVLSFERLLPLIGLGAALALVPRLSFALSLAAFCAGSAIGWNAQGLYLSLVARVPHASEHLFLTGPLATLAAGLLLLAPRPLKAVLAPPLAGLAGLLHMVAIRLTDPTLHDPRIAPLGFAAALWPLLAVALTLRAFLPRWTPIGAPILGSWLLAIGLLHGAASLVPRRTEAPLLLPPMPAQPSVPRANPFAGAAGDELFPSSAPVSRPFGAGSAP